MYFNKLGDWRFDVIKDNSHIFPLKIINRDFSNTFDGFNCGFKPKGLRCVAGIRELTGFQLLGFSFLVINVMNIVKFDKSMVLFH